MIWQRIEIRRQCRHQRFALAGPHFSDLAVMKRRTADQLHVKVAHTQGTNTRLPHHREGLRQQLLKRCALIETRTKFSGFGTECIVVKGLHTLFQRVDARDNLTHSLQLPVVTGAKNLFHG